MFTSIIQLNKIIIILINKISCLITKWQNSFFKKIIFRLSNPQTPPPPNCVFTLWDLSKTLNKISFTRKHLYSCVYEILTLA